MRPLLPSLLTLALALGAATYAQAGEPQIYLSWGAANDLPRASSSLTWTCGDTSRVDTLYLSFDPGRACSTFVGMTATLWFRALDNDSLSAQWQSAGGLALPGGMKIEFGGDTGSGYPFPWTSFGIGDYGYTRPVNTAGKLRIIYAVAPRAGARVEEGRRYGLARLLVRRPAAGVPGCGQPVCVGWTEGTMAFSSADEPNVTQGVRFVGINAAGGDHSCSVEASPAPPATGKSRKPKVSSGSR